MGRGKRRVVSFNVKLTYFDIKLIINFDIRTIFLKKEISRLYINVKRLQVVYK